MLGFSLAAAFLPISCRADVEVSVPPSASRDVASLAAVVRTELSTIPSDVAGKVNVRVAIGPEAFRIALQSGDKRPLIAAYLTSTEFEAAFQGKDRPPQVTAVFSNPDPLDQIALAQILLGRPSMGVFDSPSVRTLTSRLADTGVRLIRVRSNGDTDGLLRAAQSVDVIIALPDASVLNPSNINHVVRSLYQRRSVLIGYSAVLARVGSLASVYGTPKGISESIATMVEQYAEHGVIPEPMFVREISVAFNIQLARSLNITLPDPASTAKAIQVNRETRRGTP